MSLYNRDMKSAFMFSIGLHITPLLLLLAFSQTDYYKKKKNFQIIPLSQAVRIDVVAMPKMSLQELKKMGGAPPPIAVKETPAKEEPKQEASTDDKDAFLKEGKKLKFSDLIKKYGDKKLKIPEETKIAKSKASSKVNKRDAAFNKKLENLVMAGNKLSKGEALTGDSSFRDTTVLESYAGKIPDIVRPFWKLPTYLMNKTDLKCRIRIFIKSNGTILKAVIFESSGEKEFDERALEAVKMAGTLPMVPAKAQNAAVNGEIVLGFPL